MKRLQLARFRVVLLLALLLPLQSFAVSLPCAGAPGVAMTAHHCAHAAGHAGHWLQHEGHCACCCTVASAAAGLMWTVPRVSGLVTPNLRLPTPPAGTLDRLDRPPRRFPV